MNLNDRAKSAVVEKIESSLGYIQEEMCAVGISNFDFSSIHDEIVNIAAKTYSDNGEEVESVYLFGSSPDSTPVSLSRSVTCMLVKQWVEKLVDFISVLEKNEDAKLERWVQNKVGSDAKVDFKNLCLRNDDGKDHTIKALNIINQVLTYDRDRILRIVQQISSDANGQHALIRDLGNARLHDEGIEMALIKLLDVQDCSVLDEVEASDAFKLSEHFGVIKFVLDTLRKKVELKIADSEWRSSSEGDEADGEDTVH